MKEQEKDGGAGKRGREKIRSQEDEEKRTGRRKYRGQGVNE